MKIDHNNFDEQIISSKTPAMLVFIADWCRPCLLQKPIIETLKKDYNDRFIIELIDVDEDDKLADRFEAKTIPMTVLFAKGEIVEGLAGFQSEEFLRSYLDHILAQLKADKADKADEADND